MAVRILKLFIVFCLICCGVSAKQPEQAQDFNTILQEVLCDVEIPVNFQAVAFKTVFPSETAKYSTGNNTFNGARALRDMFGEKKQKFETTFVYLNKGKPATAQASTTWYISPYSNTKFRLYCAKNPVSELIKADDLLLLGKTYDNKLFVIVVNSKSPLKDKLLTALQTPPPDKSWYQVFFTPGPDCENNIISRLNNAKKTVDIAVFSITNNNRRNPCSSQTRGQGSHNHRC